MEPTTDDHETVPSGAGGVLSRHGRLESGWLGVLGGMGPAATADFLHRLASLTPAATDQDHIPVLVYGDSTTPDRSDAVIGAGPDPLPRLLQGVRFLAASGVDAIAIACNSAHLWFRQLQDETSTPILHIVGAVESRLRQLVDPGQPVGVLATEGTLRCRLYEDPLLRAGHPVITPRGDHLAVVMEGIRAVKAGDHGHGRDLLVGSARTLVDSGATAIVIGCTDISVAIRSLKTIDGVPIVDSTTELARTSAVHVTVGSAGTHEAPPPN